MDAKSHWEAVYRAKRPDEVSWFQREPTLSLALVARFAPDPGANVIDVGGGASTLVDHLVAKGYRRVTVLDVSAAALAVARTRLAAAAEAVTWLEADALSVPLPASHFDLWHDRAVFHFLTSPDDRARYVAQVQRAVTPGGYAIVATFAEDGPVKCSGLDVVRYSADTLHREFGAGFRLVESVREQHVTPSGATQSFVYGVCRREPVSGAAVPSAEA